MPERDLKLLANAAREAGDIALRYWRKDPQVWDKGSDDPVSEADLAADTFLKSELLKARPDHGWLSEETEDDAARQTKERLFIVDPIDGTRAFIAGQQTWAISLAIAKAGRVTAGVVYLPARDLLFQAHELGKAMLNGAKISPRSSPDDPPTFLSQKATLSSEHWPGGVPDLTREFRPSIAYRLCLVAQGRFDAMATFRRSWEWDIAAGALIAERAGCAVSDGKGNPLHFNNTHPTVDGVMAAQMDVFETLRHHRGLT